MVLRGSRWSTARVLWLALIALAQRLNEAECVCPSPYYPSTHTACLDPSPYSTAPKGVGPTDKATIVSEHNRYRTLVTATDMQMMYWDDELAFVAQKLAENCTFAHDPQRGILCKYSAGQNLALGQASWALAIQAWYNETYKFMYGNSSYVFSNIGHYTQMMWNNTAKVGCGYSYCTNYGRPFYVCNYSPAGNISPRIAYPYTNGTRCADCPNSCSTNGLCDCKGLVCKNGGVLNISTCTCTCRSPFQGSADCNLNCAGVVDPSYCNKSAPFGFPPSYCPVYNNVPADCPLMCGTCPGNECITLQSTSIAGTVTTAGYVTTAAPTTVTTGNTTTQSTTTAPTTTFTVTTSKVPTTVITTKPASSVSTTSQTTTTAATTTIIATTTIATTTTLKVNQTGSNCPSPWYPTNHTACLSSSPSSVAPRGVDTANISMIVAEHNKYRASVNATDMQMMYWDRELAYVAQKLAENCTFAHDSQRGILCKYNAGQNLALGYSSWASATQAWYNETYKFTYGSSGNNFSSVGHYTQLMWNDTAKIGCGYSYCSNLRSSLFVCNYAPAGNISPRIYQPFTNGTKCSACPNRCNTLGLCDCGGLVCKNGGVLNISTCTCNCPSPYRGSADCNLNCTGVVDPSYCNKTAGSGYPASYCSIYSNVPRECPLMCGVCPGSMCMALQSFNIANVTNVTNTTSTTSTTSTVTTPTVTTTKSTTQTVTTTKITSPTTTLRTAVTTKTTSKPTTTTSKPTVTTTKPTTSKPTATTAKLTTIKV